MNRFDNFWEIVKSATALSTLILCVRQYRTTGFFGKIRLFEITDSGLTEYYVTQKTEFVGDGYV